MGVTFSFMTIMFSSVTLLMALASFSIYATVGGPGGTPGEINSQTIFVSITLFGLLNRPIGMLSNITGETISLVVSTRRIQRFLLEEELDESQVERSEELPADPSQPVIQIQNGTFAWVNEGEGSRDETGALEKNEANGFKDDKGRDATLASLDTLPVEPNRGATLKNINLAVHRGHLTAIVGRVGQGKSSLFHAIIGEMYKREGTVRKSGRLAYAPQQAWIMNATLKDNILFGSPFDQAKYDRIVHAAGLIPDLDVLPAGDLTEIGERGINLSGGQKQRVSLARAAYQEADIYLLDDPLSAVDAHVDQHLWQYLIGPTGLLKDKTRLLITHGIHHLNDVDRIVVMKDGGISEIGCYQELVDAKLAFYQLIQDYSNNMDTRKERDGPSGEEDQTVHDDTESGSVCAANHHEKTQVVDEKLDSNADLVEEEGMQVGSIQWSVYRIYAKAA